MSDSTSPCHRLNDTSGSSLVIFRTQWAMRWEDNTGPMIVEEKRTQHTPESPCRRMGMRPRAETWVIPPHITSAFKKRVWNLPGGTWASLRIIIKTNIDPWLLKIALANFQHGARTGHYIKCSLLGVIRVCAELGHTRTLYRYQISLLNVSIPS